MAAATVLSLLTLAGLLVSLSVGQVEIGPDRIVRILAGTDPDAMARRILLDIRLPRGLTAVFVGAALAVSGAVFQSVSRNALGSPDLIGFTTGAASGAIVQIVFFRSGAAGVMVAAVAGGLLTAVVVYALAARRRVVGSYRLVLVGIGMGSILSALNGLMLAKGALDNAIMANLWLAGSLSARNWGHVVPVMLGCILLIPVIVLLARQLSLVEMGDDLAAQLGVRVERVRLVMVLCAVILAALATGAAGPIAFIALAAPQLAGRLTPAGRLPVMVAAAMGALLMVIADLIGHVLPLGVSLPIGRLTGVVGGLYLIWLLSRSRTL
ncbi:FecCD family ABC transporter permease [Marinobacter lutaoensis]|jgi:iron complex transport system permease protein|nr:iron chelate uptake ABC transporter family permease subunit [Marinobacter lutaoensis]